MKHAPSIASFVMGVMIAAFGADDVATAAPERIGCYGDNWGPTLAMLEPTPNGPMTFKTIRCLPIPESWPRILPPFLSPNGHFVAAFGFTKGLWLGDVTRGGRSHTIKEPLPGDFLLRTAPFAWLDDSSAVIGVKRHVAMQSGFAVGHLRPYLFALDGSEIKLPELVHPNGPLDEIYWVGGSGLALAAFGTQGSYDKPKHKDRKPTLALVDARNGTILQSVERDSIPELVGQRSLEAVKSRIDPFGKAHILIAWAPGKWLLWVQGQPPRVVPLASTTRRTPFTLSSDASSVLIMGNLSATGALCEWGNSCSPPTPQSGTIAELRDVSSGRVKWTLSGTASYFSHSAAPGVSPDGRYGLISLPDENGTAIALISMDTGKVIQKFEQPGWGPIGLSFSSDSKFGIIAAGTVMATFAIDQLNLQGRTKSIEQK
ncbi:hypothetical protein [Rhizobium phaseoli]|uniref:hypothetical protein n=1 Tax=Rhizobium phaseoli TaxID=396 RepID=UPI0007EAC2BB|nr:hypothetical protein [Rhizobium phaseoli]ANL42409.1 hypothetical protein AMC88_CH04076 [Rhizobium phaseoli]ANL61395.1 hypothetical protein AMC85_CH04073 [Rhizobium phaseoli]